MPNSLKITSKDLINQYGRLFDGQQIYKLAVYGFIDSQVLIEVYEINEALKYINYDGRILENDELDEFYSPKALIGMKLNGDISPKFAQSYVEMQDFENNKEKFKEKSESLIENLRILTGDKKSQEFQENLLFFFKIGFCDLENAKQNISEEYIENKISNNEMKIEEVFELYEKGLLNDDFMLKYYKPEEIFEFYKNDEITGKSLRLVNDVDFLTQKFCDREIDIQDFLNLYLTEDILSVYDLDDALVLAESDVDISNFIDENVYFEKIKELFSNYLIDYSFILTLKEQQIINENEFNEIKATLDTREFFQELEEGKKFVVVTSREQNIQKGKKTTSSSDKKKNDFSDEIDLISKVLEKDVENESYSVIESYNKKGRLT